MISAHWLKRRQPHWARLEALLADVERLGLGGLGRNELRELGLLYRQTATDLSALRADPSSTQQARYLNQLLGPRSIRASSAACCHTLWRPRSCWFAVSCWVPGWR